MLELNANLIITLIKVISNRRNVNLEICLVFFTVICHVYRLCWKTGVGCS